MTFTAIEKGKHGETVYVDDPKIEAYKHAAYIQNVLHQNYRLTCHEDGAYTVATLTFERQQ